MTDPSDSFATPRVAAGALFLDDRGRVLLVHPTYKDTWDVPGGYVERGESPAAACQRELKEELRIDRAPILLINVDGLRPTARATGCCSSLTAGGLAPVRSTSDWTASSWTTGRRSPSKSSTSTRSIVSLTESERRSIRPELRISSMATPHSRPQLLSVTTIPPVS